MEYGHNFYAMTLTCATVCNGEKAVVTGESDGSPIILAYNIKRRQIVWSEKTFLYTIVKLVTTTFIDICL